MTTVSVRQRNRTALKKGFDTFRQKLELVAMSAILKKGISVIQTEYDSKGWQGFTGNAQLSYGFFLYDGKGGLWDKYLTLDHHRSPIMPKIDEGRTVWLEEPYEGESRRVKGKARLETATAEAAMKAIEAKPQRRRGKVLWRGRFTLGVEYEPYLVGDPYDKLHATAALVMRGLGRAIKI